MSKKIEIYLHRENQQKPEIVEVQENTSYSGLMNELPINDSSEYNLFEEDQEIIENKDKVIKLKVKSHFHCHRCKKVEITVTYNGQNVQLSLPPSSTGDKILRKSCKEFGITEDDATDLHLKSGSVVFKTKDHIGSYVSFPNCKIQLNLLPNNQMQG